MSSAYPAHRSRSGNFDKALGSVVNGHYADLASSQSVLGGAKINSELIQKKKQYLLVSRKRVNDHLNRLEDPISSKWLQQQLESSSDNRATLTAQHALLQTQAKAAMDEAAALRGLLNRKEQSFTAALQRQQDARLRGLAIRRIRKVVKFQFDLWRKARSDRIRYSMTSQFDLEPLIPNTLSYRLLIFDTS